PPPVIVEHGVGLNRLVTTHDASGPGTARRFAPRMHHEESSVFYPLERGVCASDGRWISWKHEFDTPLTNQYLKALQSWIGLRWRRLCLSRGEVIWHHAFSFPF